MLTVSDLSVNRGGRDILCGVDFTLLEGQWLMVVGPNGAGKTTLVNAIAQGLAHTGAVLFEGRELSEENPRKRARKVGVLLQSNPVGFSFTVEEVVRLGRYAYGHKIFNTLSAEDEEKIEQALHACGLQEKRGQSVLTLSGGELQRTFLAQLFAQDPQVLLLDEPSSHLDLVYQKQLFELIGSWLKQPKRAVLSVVHDLSLARAYGTDALMLSEGRCVASGAVEQVLAAGNLNEVYSMDVFAWMQKMLAQWRT